MAPNWPSYSGATKWRCACISWAEPSPGAPLVMALPRVGSSGEGCGATSTGPQNGRICVSLTIKGSTSDHTKIWIPTNQRRQKPDPNQSDRWNSKGPLELAILCYTTASPWLQSLYMRGKPLMLSTRTREYAPLKKYQRRAITKTNRIYP